MPNNTLPQMPHNETIVSVASLARVNEIILEMITEGLTAGEIAERHGMQFGDVVSLLNDPDFSRKFSEVRRKLAVVEFDSVGHREMINVMRGDDTRSKVSAYKAMADVLGVTEKKVKVSHEHKWVDATIGALEAEGKIIDVEVVNDSQN